MRPNTSSGWRSGGKWRTIIISCHTGAISSRLMWAIVYFFVVTVRWTVQGVWILTNFYKETGLQLVTKCWTDMSTLTDPIKILPLRFNLILNVGCIHVVDCNSNLHRLTRSDVQPCTAELISNDTVAYNIVAALLHIFFTYKEDKWRVSWRPSSIFPVTFYRFSRCTKSSATGWDYDKLQEEAFMDLTVFAPKLMHPFVELDWVNPSRLDCKFRLMQRILMNGQWGLTVACWANYSVD